MKSHYSALLIAGALIFTVGCATTVTSNTPRTAKEQMLVSNAVDQSLDKVDFTPLHNQNVFVEEKYLECVDKPYLVGSVRHRVFRAGGTVVDKPEDADIVMELRSGAVGTDTNEAYLGTPEIALPGMLTIPEIRFAERKSQFGYAKVGIMMFDAKTRKALGDGGLAMAESDDNNTFVMGIGPFQNGSLKRDVGKARRIPSGMYRRELPSTVALGTRTDMASGSDIQFASETRETGP